MERKNTAPTSSSPEARTQRDTTNKGQQRVQCCEGDRESPKGPGHSNSGNASSRNCEKPKFESNETNSEHDFSKDTLKLLPSEFSKDVCCSGSDSLNLGHASRPDISFSQLHLKIKVLYGLFVCLTAIFVCSGVMCMLQIWRLRTDLDLMNDTIEHLKKSSPSPDQLRHLTDFYRTFGRRYQAESNSFWETVSGEVKRSSREENREDLSNTEQGKGKRQKRGADDDAAPEDWAWMSTFVRVPVSTLRQYHWLYMCPL